MRERIDFAQYITEEREEIVHRCALTQSEREVFSSRADGDSVVAASMRLNLSEATVKRRSAAVQKKIARMHALERRKNRPHEDVMISM